jgi:hypothetical protein
MKLKPAVRPTQGGPPSKKQRKKDEKNQFLWAEGQQESGGNYHAINANSGALGRWQVMPENLPGWAEQCGLPTVSPDYYLSHPAYQDKLVYCILGGYYDQYGPRGAASMWYSGQPDWQARYGDPPVYRYVDDVIALMGGAPVSGTGSGGLGETGTSGPYPRWAVPPPKPGKESWATQIRQTSAHFSNTARLVNSHTVSISRNKIRL